MPFDSTLMGPNSNSYVSVEEADDYFDLNPKYSFWSPLSIQQKQQFLVQATTRLNYDQYGGRRTETVQALEWPRLWIIDRNYDQNQDFVEYVGGSYYQDPYTQPRELKIATFELAMWYNEEINLENPMWSRNDIDRMESVSIGPLQAKLRKTKEAALPDVVVRALTAIGPNGWYGRRMMSLVR